MALIIRSQNSASKLNQNLTDKMSVLKVENVVKTFGDLKAVDGASFEAEPGRIFGLLGPNGAGKTTLIRMITGIHFPNSGTIEVFGKAPSPDTQNRIGYLPEERGLYKKMKIIDQIAYFAQLKGLSKSDAIAKADYWLGRMDASKWKTMKIQELSKGMQQKIQFITTILHSPELLILDEPFSGFDPVNAELIKNIVLELKEKGTAIILSTHVMEQAEQLCDDICLINKGKILIEGGMRIIKESYAKDTAIVEFDGSPEFLDEFDDIRIVNKAANRAEFRLTSDFSANEILKTIMKTANVTKFELSEPSLREIFIDAVSEKEEGDE